MMQIEQISLISRIPNFNKHILLGNPVFSACLGDQNFPTTEESHRAGFGYFRVFSPSSRSQPTTTTTTRSSSSFQEQDKDVKQRQSGSGLFS